MSIDRADLRSAGALAPALLDALAPLEPAAADGLPSALAGFAWSAPAAAVRIALAPGGERTLEDAARDAGLAFPSPDGAIADAAAGVTAAPPAPAAHAGGEVQAVAAARFVDLADGHEILDTRAAPDLFAPAPPRALHVAGAPVAQPADGALGLITVSDAVADEGGGFLNFVVTLSAPATQAVSVSYNNSSITASNGSDYSAQSGTVTFGVGETTKTITIPVLNDGVAERTELIALNLFSAVNGTIIRPLAYGSIYDNDQAPGTPVVRVADQVVDEASGQVSFVVTLDRPSTGTVKVDVSTVNGTAAAGSDYTALSPQTLTFGPGEMVKVVNVGLVNDSVAEGREYFDLKLSSPVGATLQADPTGRATIGANDSALVSLPSITVADAVADETSTTIDFVVSLSAPSTQAVSVSYNNSSVTVGNGSDYVAQASTITFAPGETTKVVKIPVLDTAGLEPTEYLALNLFSAVNATIGRPLAYGAIYDNDQTSGTPLIRVSDQVVDEASGQVSFIVTLDKPATGNVSVNVATVDGTAVAGSDYAALATKTLTFAPGEMVKVVNVGLVNDSVAEGREYFDLKLSSPVGATILPDPTGRATIGANDAATVSLPSITVADAVANEGGGTMLEFVVSLSAPSTQAVSVSYNNSSVTVGNGSDYVAQASTITFAPGETTKVVKIPVLDTTGPEPTEYVGLNLFSAVNATIGRPLAYGAIYDNDQTSGTPLIRVSDQVVDEASGQVSFIVTLDKPATGNVSVNVATVDGTAVAGSDYVALAAKTLTFTPGEMVKVVNVGLVNDSVAEGREYFDLKLSSPVGGTLLPDPTGRAAIGANDAATVSLPSISVSDTVASEGGGSTLNFTVSLSAPSTQAVTVSYDNSSVTAGNGSDYVAQSSTITFAPGETTKVVKIPVLDNVGTEAAELVALNLFNAVNGTIGRPLAYGTIVDDDQSIGTPVIRVADQIVDEAAGQVDVVLTLDRPSAGNVSVNVGTVNGSALAGSDYLALATRTVTFTPGEVSKVVTVDLINDTAHEGGETFDLHLFSPVGATLPDTNARVFIGPSDAATASLPRISVSEAGADESDTTMQFVVSLDAPSTQAVTVSYSCSNVSASNGSDYLAQSSFLTFAPGETTKVVKIPVLNDLASEPTEYMSLNIFNAVNGTIAQASAFGSIHDNDGTNGTPQLSVSDGIVDETGARAAFTVTLSQPSTDQVTVRYATFNGVANSGDYEPQPTQTMLFAPGEVSKTVYVDLRDDANAEAAEFFDLALSSPVNATIADGRGHMIISPSDAATVATPSIAGVAVATPEAGGLMDFVITLNAPSTQVVTVAYSNSNVSATSGSDYLAQSGTLSFAPGETLKVVHIPVLNDLLVENTETFNLNLFNPVNATLSSTTVIGSILDDDGNPLGSQFITTGTGNGDVLVGRPGANSVVGGAGNDVLDGVNGVTMDGGTGNDLYIVESTADKVTEGLNGGTDTVASYINYTLGANVEKLVMLGTALTGTGNALNNAISGNGSNNTIDGKEGADTMTGAAGDDTFVVDNPGDIVNEGADAGTDSVKSSITFALPDNVENLTLTGAAAIDATGNALANAVVGNTAANVLNGGTGADVLSGGGGSDTFVFDNSVGGFDTVTDWSSATGTLRFVMSGLHVGDGDGVVEGATTRSAPGGFAPSAELVVFTTDIVGPITAASAAAAIGSATSAYATGANVLFAVDNGTQSGVFLFQSSGSDALVSAAELTQVALLDGGPTSTADYVFVP